MFVFSRFGEVNKVNRDSINDNLDKVTGFGRKTEKHIGDPTVTQSTQTNSINMGKVQLGDILGDQILLLFSVTFPFNFLLGI